MIITLTAANQNMPAGHAYPKKKKKFICSYTVVVYGRSREVYVALSSAPPAVASGARRQN